MPRRLARKYSSLIETDFENIIVFKTSVNQQSDIFKLSQHLNKIIKKGKWNFDLEDCDKILRIESKRNIIKSIICLLNNNGFECIELED